MNKNLLLASCFFILFLAQSSCSLFFKPRRNPIAHSETASADSSEGKRKKESWKRLNFSNHNYVKIYNKFPPTIITILDTIPRRNTFPIFHIDSPLRPFVLLKSEADKDTIIVEGNDHFAFKDKADSIYFVNYYSYETVSLNATKKHAISLPNSGVGHGNLHHQNASDWWKIQVLPESEFMIKIEVDNPKFKHDRSNILFESTGKIEFYPTVYDNNNGRNEFHIKSKSEDLYVKITNPLTESVNYSIQKEKGAISDGIKIETWELTMSNEDKSKRVDLDGGRGKLLKFQTTIPAKLQIYGNQSVGGINLKLLNVSTYSEYSEINAPIRTQREYYLEPGNFYLKVQADSQNESPSYQFIDLKYRFSPRIAIPPDIVRIKFTPKEQNTLDVGAFLLNNAFRFVKDKEGLINLLKELFNDKKIIDPRICYAISQCYKNIHDDSLKVWKARGDALKK